MKVKIGNEEPDLNKVDIPSLKVNNYEEELKDTFYVLKQNKWIEINFKDIKKKDIIVKKSCKNCYFSVDESSTFCNDLNDFAIIVDELQKIDVDFDWSL